MADPALPMPVPFPVALDGRDPHGRRYTPEERETAYLAWRGLYGRSRRRTAKELKIAAPTVASWAKADDWEARADREDAEDALGARSSLQARLLPGADAMLSVLEEIAGDTTAPAMARVRAAVDYCHLAGLGPGRGGGGILPIPPTEAGRATVDLDRLRHLTPDELATFRETGRMPETAPPAAG